MRTTIGLVAMALLAGCGKRETIDVRGAVTFDGKPLASGFVTFVPKIGTARGAEIADGQYACANLDAGECTVLVTTPARYEPSPTTKSGLALVKTMTVPTSAVGNNRTVELHAGEQTIDLDLKKKK